MLKSEKRLPFFIGIIVLELQNAFRRYKRLMFPRIPAGYDAGNQAFLSTAGLFRLLLFSSFCFALSFLLVRILSVFILSGLLYVNEINHVYSIFNVAYLPGDNSKWSDGNLLLVHGAPDLVFLAVGVYLTNLAGRLKKISWVSRLMLTWFAFVLVIFFLSELLLAAFQYKGLGIALQWLISNELLKYLIIAAGTIGLVLWSRRFGRIFLRSCPSRIFLEETSLMRTWLIWVLLLPLVFGSAFLLLILFYSLKISLAALFISAIITLPMAFRSVDYLPDVRIYKSNRNIPGIYIILTMMILLGIAVRLLVMFV